MPMFASWSVVQITTVEQANNTNVKYKSNQHSTYIPHKIHS